MKLAAFFRKLQSNRILLIVRSLLFSTWVAFIFTGCNQGAAVPSTEIPASPIQMNTPVPTNTLVLATETMIATDTPALNATPEPNSEETPAQSVIEPGNAPDLQQVSEINESGAMDFSWLAGDQLLALASENGISLYRAEPAVETGQIPAQTPQMLTTSPAQHLLAWVSEDQAVHLWNAIEGREIHTFSGQTGDMTSLAFSPQGNHLAASSNENSISIWDTTSGELLKTITIPNWLSNLSYSPDGSLLGGVDLQSYTIHILDASTGEEYRSLTWTETASPVLYGAIFSKDWKSVAWYARGTVQVMDVATGELGPTLSHEDFINSIDWSPDGRLLATSSAATVNGNYAPVISIWDTASGESVNTLVQTEPVISLAFSPDGKQLASLNSGGGLQLWVVPAK